MSPTAYLPTYLPYLGTYAVRLVVVSVVAPGEGWRPLPALFCCHPVLEFYPVGFGRGYLASFLHAWD